MYLSLCNFLNRQILGLSKKLIRFTYWMLKTEIHIAIDSVWKIISLKHLGHDCLHMWREANAEVHFPEPAWHIWFEKNNCVQLLHRYQSGHLEPWTRLLQRTVVLMETSSFKGLQQQGCDQDWKLLFIWKWASCHFTLTVPFIFVFLCCHINFMHFYVPETNKQCEKFQILP